MARLPTAVEKAAYEEEVQRAALEDREPKWGSLYELLENNISEENLVWGSQSMRDYGKKGRHESHGTSDETDKELGVVTDGGSTTYPETLHTDESRTEQVVDPDAYDANKQLGTAIAAGITAGFASDVVVEDDSDKDSEDSENELTQLTGSN